MWPTSEQGRPTVYRSGRLYIPGGEPATALVVVDDRIVFVGSDAEAEQRGSGGRSVNLGGRLVTPAFVDAHLHTIQTGQVILGLDLHGVRSRAELLDRLRRYCAAHPGRRVVVGQGWDERYWPDPVRPTRAELDRAAGDVAVYLARVDVHSAVVSSALLAAEPRIVGADGYAESGPLTRDAHHLARRATDRLFSDAERRDAAAVALRRCAAVGVGTVHELGGPHLGPLEDLTRVREVAADLGLDVVAYWGERAGEESLRTARALDLAGLAGDLCIDGALGSRTAALREDYADAATRGARYLSAEEITDHVVACTKAGLQAGFHCIGDDAVGAAVAGLRRAAEQVGLRALRAAHPRLEHVEMVTPEDLGTLADLGVTASVQPAFDAAWGGPGELYEQRLGPERSRDMNPFGSMRRAGVPLAFGTDAPVTPPAGWGMVRAAARHHREEQRLSVAEAFEAATAGGHRAARRPPGRLAVGAAGSFAVWDDPAGSVQESGLPALDDGEPPPVCVGLWVRGRSVLDEAGLAAE